MMPGQNDRVASWRPWRFDSLAPRNADELVEGELYEQGLDLFERVVGMLTKLAEP